jgi:hypothetical protein
MLADEQDALANNTVYALFSLARACQRSTVERAPQARRSFVGGPMKRPDPPVEPPLDTHSGFELVLFYVAMGCLVLGIAHALLQAYVWK